MIIRTLQDAELELKYLQDRIALLERRARESSSVSEYLTRSEVKSLISVALRGITFPQSQEVDSVATESAIFHYLVHRFLSTVYIQSLVPVGSVIPLATNTVDLGTTSLRFKTTYGKSLDLDTGFKFSSGAGSGKVLTSDASGNGTWTTPATTTENDVLIASATSNLSLTTSYQDVSGASISLNKDGTWLILGIFNISMNSDGSYTMKGTLNYDGTDQTQEALYVSSETGSVLDIVTIPQVWVITVSGQPKTAKLRGRKDGGSGSSTINSGHTRITGIYIKA